jgi:hypothetical protein
MRKVSFCEEPVWATVAGEWRPLFGNFFEEGVSVEWHDFECAGTLDWSRSFHPDSLEICINFEGCGVIHERPSQTTVVKPQRVAHYTADAERLRATGTLASGIAF